MDPPFLTLSYVFFSLTILNLSAELRPDHQQPTKGGTS